MGNIGVCLSGGGHRASVFSLGALLYLVDVDRHRDVQAISSVSGGSLTNAFLATQESPFSSIDPATFEKAAAAFAHRIAGSPRWWWAALTIHLILFVWWLSQLPSLLGLQPACWHAQAIYGVAVLLCARTVSYRSGGSFWAWWGTWVYVSVLLPGLVLLFASWFSAFPWKSCVLLTALICVIFRCCNLVADRAFRHMIRNLGGARRVRLRDIHAAPRHVFCATDMETGKHVYFSNDLLFAPRLGVGTPGKLSVGTATQVSANFPVAFPYRRLNPDGHDFRLLAPCSTWQLVLSDGGVCDNVGLTWFSEASTRVFELRQRLEVICGGDALWHRQTIPDEVQNRVFEQMRAMEQQPDMLICVNSSAPYSTRKVWFSRIPILAELASLVDVQAVMYNRLGIQLAHQLRRKFLSEPLTGTMVSIEEDPDTITVLAASKPDALPGIKNYYGIPSGMLDRYHDAAEQILERSREGAQELHRKNTQRLHSLADRSRKTATTFRPLGIEATAEILEHGYLTCMANCHLLLGFPRFENPPSALDFARLARGSAREHRPELKLAMTP
jgi:hypothetical protein